MKMDPMPTNRRMLTWLCAYPAPEATNKWMNLAHILFIFGIFVVVIEYLIASSMFFNAFVRIDLEITLYAMFQMAAGIGLMNIITTAIVLRNRIKDIFDGLEDIYKVGEKEGWFHFLDEMNQRSEWIWKYYAIFAMGGWVMNNIVMSCASIVYCLVTYGAFDTTHLFRAYKFILPWNQTTELGYFFEIFFGILFGESYFVGNGSVLLLFISVCLHHMAFYNRFKYELSKLGKSKDSKNDKKLLCELIQFHHLVKSWLFETANIYSPFILFQLISNVVFLAPVIFHLDLQTKHFDLSAVIILTGGMASATNLFFFCYFGTLATECYENMADCVYDSNWLELPIDLKKYLIMMIANAQQPIYYHGFGFARLRMRTFTSLINTVFSYYMMFKTLTKKN